MRIHIGKYKRGAKWTRGRCDWLAILIGEVYAGTRRHETGPHKRNAETEAHEEWAEERTNINHPCPGTEENRRSCEG